MRNIGFHDVDYHSGEIYDSTDWTGARVTDAGGNAVLWETESSDVNPNANALRWGTLYNFRFEADVPPLMADVTLGLFLPGSPSEMIVTAVVPSRCNSDGTCEGAETCSNCADCVNQLPATGDCGDGICEPGIGESCISCADCNGEQGGMPGNRFCCGDGAGEGPVGCGDGRCTTGGFECGSTAVEVCCGDATCDTGVEDSCTCSSDCGAPAPFELLCDDGLDDDCDGSTDCIDLDCCAEPACTSGTDADEDGVADCDCDDGNDQVWAAPGEAQALELHPDGGGTALAWLPPGNLGGTAVTYEVLRSEDAADFLTVATCLPSADPSIPSSSDGELPATGTVYYYLARAMNACPAGSGSLGAGSSGVLRSGRSCP